MNKSISAIFFNTLITILLVITSGCAENKTDTKRNDMPIKTDDTKLTYILPAPQLKGTKTVEEAISNRRSRRNFRDKEISAEILSQILWAAYGISEPASGNPSGLRTAPSAGALYPLEVYVIIGDVKDIQPGVYKYLPKEHKIVMTINKDIRNDLCAAARNQEMIRTAPAVIFYSAVYSRCTDRYGTRGRERYVCMDLGHSAQNIYLQAEALNLGTCAIGSFNDNEVKQVIQLPADEEPLYIMPVGYYYSAP